MSAMLMFRRVKNSWVATVRPGRAHAIVGLSREGWKAALYHHDASGELLVDHYGTYGTRQEAQQAASDAILGGGWHDGKG